MRGSGRKAALKRNRLERGSSSIRKKSSFLLLRTYVQYVLPLHGSRASLIHIPLIEEKTRTSRRSIRAFDLTNPPSIVVTTGGVKGKYLCPRFESRSNRTSTLSFSSFKGPPSTHIPSQTAAFPRRPEYSRQHTLTQLRTQSLKERRNLA